MFTLTHQYKYTLTELENMIPWERDLYVGMVNTWAKEESEKLKQQTDQQKQDLRNIFKKSKRR
jgi:hypothetical protein